MQQRGLTNLGQDRRWDFLKTMVFLDNFSQASIHPRRVKPQQAERSHPRAVNGGVFLVTPTLLPHEHLSHLINRPLPDN